MMNIKQTIKRMVLTGAAVTVMMSLAAPAVMAKEVSGGIGSVPIGPTPVTEQPDPKPAPPVEDTPPKDCGIFDILCDSPFGDNPVLDQPIDDPPPAHCVKRPILCDDFPFDDIPVLEDIVDEENPEDTDPPENEEEPVVTDPPKNEDPNQDEQPNTGGGGSGGGTGGGSSGPATSGGGSSGGSVSSASQTIDRGGNFVSSILPYTLTTKIGDAGSAVKKNLPTPVAKSLPNTGGGWSFLVLVGSALIAGGFAIRTIVRRKTSAA